MSESSESARPVGVEALRAVMKSQYHADRLRSAQGVGVRWVGARRKPGDSPGGEP